jgi:hypothetical protein
MQISIAGIPKTVSAFMTLVQGLKGDETKASFVTHPKIAVRFKKNWLREQEINYRRISPKFRKFFGMATFQPFHMYLADVLAFISLQRKNIFPFSDSRRKEFGPKLSHPFLRQLPKTEHP